jgi:hypothetical protein
MEAKIKRRQNSKTGINVHKLRSKTISSSKITQHMKNKKIYATTNFQTVIYF